MPAGEHAVHQCVRSVRYHWIIPRSEGAFRKSELAGQTTARPVILTMKNAFFQVFLLERHLLHACYLGSGWIVLVVLNKSEIVIMTGMVCRLVSSDKWKSDLSST